MSLLRLASQGLRHVIDGLRRGLAALLVAVACFGAAAPAEARSAAEIDAAVDWTLVELFRLRPDLRGLYDRAEGVVVVPDIVKGGFIVGGAYGEGALVVDNQIDSYWSYGAGSIGFQAGLQRASRVVFFMTPAALDSFLALGGGGAVGADAEVTVLDEGGAVEIDSRTALQPVIVVNFGRQGLLGGASLRGGAYDRIYPH